MEFFKVIAQQDFVALFQESVINLPRDETMRAFDYCTQKFANLSPPVVGAALHHIRNTDPVGFRVLWSHCERPTLHQIDTLFTSLREALRDREIGDILRQTFLDYYTSSIDARPDVTVSTVLGLLGFDEAVVTSILGYHSRVLASMVGEADRDLLFSRLRHWVPLEDFVLLFTGHMDEPSRLFILRIMGEMDEGADEY